MAFIPETGDGIDGANSYASVAAADDYFADRGNAAWAASDTAAKQAALLEASSYLDGQYRGVWVGALYSASQGLAWPREDARDPDGRTLSGVPTQVQEAVFRLALEALSGQLSAAYSPDARVSRKKIGPLETEFVVETNRAPGKRYPFLDILLSGLVTAGHGMIRLERC